jgi:Polysaccharide pyruvyl transferase
MSSPPRFRVFIHQGTGNLGDAIQTIALCRLLGSGCVGVYRDRPIPEAGAEIPLVANGWLGYHRPNLATSAAVFAGVHLARHEAAFARWIAQSPSPAGARDPYTEGLLGTFGVPSEMIGCATLTFPRYRGVRQGRLAVDANRPDTEAFTNQIPNLDWPTQWAMAVTLLDRLRRAEVVYTSRLHVALPCLAFGTPVVFPSAAFEAAGEKQRLSLLFDLPFAFDEPVTADVGPQAERFTSFLTRALGPLETGAEAAMPVRPEVGVL